MHVIANQDNNTYVGDLITSREQVTPQAIVSAVYDIFVAAPALEAMAVVDDLKPVGLITRMKLFYTLSRRFGNELHAKHPIITIADTTPLIVSEEELLDSVIDRAFNRSTQDIYDDIIVTDTVGAYLGLLSVKELVLQQSSALTRNVVLREMATARAQELERINAVKSQFLANVTHELRSPVNAIVGLTQLLKTATDKGSIELIEERLSFMMSTATNLRSIITNILDLSKIEAGKMEVSYQMVDVLSLVSEVAETTRILIGDKPVTVVVTAPDEPITITTDPIMLRHIIMNLTSNAAKFTTKGSIEIGIVMLDAKMEVRVSDTGIGIKEENLQLIFTAFGQVEDATTKTHEGTGLGLTISKNLAKLLGGSISVTSMYGAGTTFSVSIPLQHSEQRSE